MLATSVTPVHPTIVKVDGRDRASRYRVEISFFSSPVCGGRVSGRAGWGRGQLQILHAELGEAYSPVVKAAYVIPRPHAPMTYVRATPIGAEV